MEMQTELEQSVGRSRQRGKVGEESQRENNRCLQFYFYFI